MMIMITMKMNTALIVMTTIIYNHENDENDYYGGDNDEII